MKPKAIAPLEQPQLGGLDMPAMDLPALGGGLAMPDLGLLPPVAAADQAADADKIEEMEAAMADLSTIAGRAKQEQARFRQATDTEFWLCLCFETREQKEEYLKRSKLDDLGDKHINGLIVAQRQGIPLKSPRPTFREARMNEKLSAISEETPDE